MGTIGFGQERRDLEELAVVVVREVQPVAHARHQVQVGVQHAGHQVPTQ